MSWKDEYHEAVIMAIVRNGSPLGKDASIYGWHAWEKDYLAIVAMIKRRGIDFKKSTFNDSYWYEFAGTFAEEDNRIQGIEANIVLKGGISYTYRWSGSFSELLTAVLTHEPPEVG